MTTTDRIAIRVTINGEAWQGFVEPADLLLDLLRDRLRLTGTKRGCERLACGACTVLVDGMPISACGMLAVDADCRDVVTIEGLGGSDSLTRLQEAFVTRVAAQCGYCTPGQLVSATALLRAHCRPTRQQIQEWMRANLCRCGSYGGIIEAIESASRQAEEPS
jgi:aerobic-type carbon monoxide dehydrogenase small subunit (CoxS/CutS family)